MNRGIFNEKLHQKFKIYSDLKVQEKALYGLQLKKWIKLKTKIIIKKYAEYSLHFWVTSFLSLDTNCYIRHFSKMVHIKQKSRYFSKSNFKYFCESISSYKKKPVHPSCRSNFLFSRIKTWYNIAVWNFTLN